MIKFLQALTKPKSSKFNKSFYFECNGFCSTCDQNVTFSSNQEWFRDHLFCNHCGSIPRERALMQVIEQYYPDWRNLVIHESSPGNRGASSKIQNGCQKYIPTHYFPNQPLGKEHQGVRCENLEMLTFEDESIDIHITQDVMEHIFNPDKAFKEIARTLKPGGAHIFSVPIINKMKPSKTRALLDNKGLITHLEEPVFHGNPIDNSGSLVTTDWGFDIVNYIYNSSGLFTHLIHIDDTTKGIRAEYIEILVTLKQT